MADNVNITPGSGNTVAADEVTDSTLGTVKVQYTKLMDGTIDSTNKLIVSASGAAKVDGSSVTQPVSLAVAPTTTVVQPTGTNLHVVVDSAPTTTVTGSVSVSNFPTTQPVSGTVTANAGTGTFAVSATSLPLPTGASTSANQTNGNQQTQIVQGGNTAVVDATGDLQVDVNNFPATQTVAGTVTANAGTGNFTVVQPTGSNLHTVIDSGSVTLSGTSPVSGTVTSNQGSPASTSNRWPVQLTDGTDLALVSAAGSLQVDGSGVTQPVSGTLTVQQPTASNLQATVTQQSITKGTQGSTGVTTQDLKDAGRTTICFSIDRIAGVAAEALATFTINKGGVVTTGTSYTVTAGKTLRIQSFSISVADSTTTAVNGRVRIRAAASVLVTSPIFALLDASNSTGTALAGAGDDLQLSIPDGLEIAGGQQVGISQILSSTASTLTVGVIGFEY